MSEYFTTPTQAQEGERERTEFSTALLFEHLPPEPTVVDESLAEPQAQSWTIGEGADAVRVEQRVGFLLLEAAVDQWGIAQKTIEYHLTDAAKGRVDVQIQFHAPLASSQTMDATVVVFTHVKGIETGLLTSLQQTMADFATEHIAQRYHMTPKIDAQILPTAPQVDKSEKKLLVEEGRNPSDVDV